MRISRAKECIKRSLIISGAAAFKSRRSHFFFQVFVGEASQGCAGWKTETLQIRLLLSFLMYELFGELSAAPTDVILMRWKNILIG